MTSLLCGSADQVVEEKKADDNGFPFNGTWKLDKKENQDAYLTAMGVGAIKKALFQKSTVTMVVSGTDEGVEVKSTASLGFTSTAEWKTKYDTPLETTALNGNEVTKVFTYSKEGPNKEGPTMTVKTTPKGGKEDTRVWSLDKGNLVVKLTAIDEAATVATLTYVKAE